MREGQYLFSLIQIFNHILVIFLCIDQMHYNLLCKIQFCLNLINHFFNSLILHYLGNKQIFKVIVKKPFFSCGLSPLGSILTASLDESIYIHLHISLDEEHNSCLSSYSSLSNFFLAALGLA